MFFSLGVYMYFKTVFIRFLLRSGWCTLRLRYDQKAVDINLIFMKRKLLFLLGILLVLVSCQKQIDTFQENVSHSGKEFDYDRFFPESESNKPGIKTIFEYLKSEHSKKAFLSDFVAIAGYPRWDKIIYRKADSVYVIPLVSENNIAITGMLMAELLNGQVKCRYSLLIDYGKMGEIKKEFVLSMIQLEHYVFGHTGFKIYDHSLLGTAKVIHLRKRQQETNLTLAQNANTNDDPCHIVEIWTDPTEEECHCSGDEFYSGRWFYEGDCFSSMSIPYTLPWGNGSSYTLQGSQPLGGGGGSNPPPYASTFVDRLNYLLSQLDMTPESNEFLPTSEATVNEMYHYLYNNSSEDRIEIASEHIQRMAIDAGYLSFVTGYRTSTGNSITPWWNNQTWLDDPTHFNLDITRANNQFEELTAAEKALIAAYPLQAFVIRLNVDVAHGTSQATGLPDILNGKQDAFRHAFFQAINTRDVPPRLSGPGAASTTQIVSMFAVAHESEVPPELQLEKQMDIFNNNVGIIYCGSCWGTSNSTVVNAIMNKLTNGELKYIKPLDFVASKPYDLDNDGIQDCPTCLNGIVASSILTPTNQ